VSVDANQIRAEGEATDLSHAVPFAATHIWAGDADCASAVPTVIPRSNGVPGVEWPRL
jgi:hypothetical protein